MGNRLFQEARHFVEQAIEASNSTDSTPKRKSCGSSQKRPFLGFCEFNICSTATAQ